MPSGQRQRRSLVEKTAEGFTQQPVVMEYMTELLIDRVCRELINITQSVPFLNCYAILKATSKDYIRDSQKRTIVEPIVTQAIATLGSKDAFVTKLKQLLEQFRNGLSNDAEILRHPSPLHQLDSNYAISNLLNLFNYLEVDLTGFDFSGFSIWQAYLADVKRQQVNFARADFSKTVFTETFGGISCVTFSPGCQLLATSDTSGKVQLWDIANGRELFAFRSDAVWTWTVAFSADGHWLASAGDDRTIKVWNVKTGKCLKTFYGHGSWVWSVAFSPDGDRLASTSYDQSIKLWDLEENLCMHTFTGHLAPVMTVAFDATGRFDRGIKVWDIETKRCLATYRGHTGSVYSLAYSSDMIFSGGFDETVRFWNVKTGNCLQVLRTPCPYDGMNIEGVSGLTDAQRQTLKALGATEHLSVIDYPLLAS